MTGQYHNTRGLLSHFVETLRLRPDAPFQSECSDSKMLIKAWRRSQEARMNGVRLELASRDVEEINHG